jgi:hypothetical protein
VPDQLDNVGIANSLRGLRSDRAIDQTFQNLLRALTLCLELRARYRVFEFEASQDGHLDTARLFGRLRRVEGEQIAELLAGLQERLGALEPATPGEGIG